jgi:phage FluMu protein Com
VVTEQPSQPIVFRDWRCPDCGAKLARVAMPPGSELAIYCRRCRETKHLQVT